MTRRETALKYFEEQKDFMNTRVKSGIEMYRKGYARLKFVLPDGTPLGGINFRAEQKSHSFNFGCNMFLLDEFETEEKNKIYRETFPKVFNYAVAPFYWDGLEPQKGKPRYGKDSERVYRRPAPDLVLEYCNQNGIRVKGHCLVYDAFSPLWLPDDPELIKKEIKKHMTEIAERYGDTIRDWDIVNEALCWTPYGKGKAGSTKLFRSEDIVRFPFKVADNLSFDRKFINDAFGIWNNFKFERTHFYLYLKDLLREGVNFDAIGLQFHQFKPREQEAEYALERYNPIRIYDVLDTFSLLNKPMQVSEITVASYNGDAEDMDIQAELVSNMYKIWFSHKNMDGIVYWNLVDGYTFSWNPDAAKGGMLNMNEGENKYGGALLYSDLSPKPAFNALKKLINEEWHTSGMFGTDENGMSLINGFKGSYEAEFEYNGRNYKKQFTIDGRDDFETVIVVD